MILPERKDHCFDRITFEIGEVIRMEFNARRPSLFVATAMMLCCALPATADEKDADQTVAKAQDNDELSEIIVTARRVEERLQDVPISITVFNQEQLDDRNIVKAADLALYTPSLTVNQRYGPETSSFAIRGFLQEANTAPSVGVYFAEATTIRSLGLTGGGSNLAVGSMMDLDNVQVLKGPQGTLFGRNTTGGAIILQPKRPTDELEGYVEASAGDYDMGRGQAVLNVPLSENWKVRFDLDSMTRKGYLENTTGIGPDNFDNTDYVYGRVSILGDITPNLEFYTIGYYSYSHTNGFSSRLVDCAPNLGVSSQLGFLPPFIAPTACAQLASQRSNPYAIESTVPNPYFKIREGQVTNQLKWTVSDNLTVKNIASYSRIVSDFSYSLAGENFFTESSGIPLFTTFGFPKLPYGQPFDTTVLGNAPGFHTENQQQYSEELQFQGRAFDSHLTWQAGAYLEVSESPNWNSSYANEFLNCTNQAALQCSDVFGIPGLSTLQQAQQKTDFFDRAGYAQGTYEFTKQWSTTAGVRYTSDLTTAENEATNYSFLAPGAPVRTCVDTIRDTLAPVSSPSQCLQGFRTTSSKPTWTLDLDYKPIDDLLVYGKWSRGYRAGGIAPSNVGAEIWQPEKLEAYEIGSKWSFSGVAPGYVDVAAFYNKFTDQQLVATTVDSSGAATGNAIINAGKSYIAGAELDSAIRLFERIDLTANYAYLDTKIQELTIPHNPIYTLVPLVSVGNPLSQTPRNRVTLSARYRVPLDSQFGTLGIGPTYTHTDRELFSIQSSPAYQYIAGTDVWNINADWRDVLGQPFDLSFFMTNVFNKLIPLVSGSEYSTLGFDSEQYGPPRMWGFRVRYTFGRHMQ
jgi:iron complex outermembrane receptor protein